MSEPEAGELLPCPCGQVPSGLTFANNSHWGEWLIPHCCRKWFLEVSEHELIDASQAEINLAWNKARRAPARDKWDDFAQTLHDKFSTEAPVEDGELRELEREIALAYVSSYLEHECQSHEPEWANPIQHGDCCWTAKVIGWAESNGLLEHHLEDKNLVRVKSEQEGR